MPREEEEIVWYVSSKSISAARYSLAKISFIYLRCMENNLVSVKMILDKFRYGLSANYEQAEAMQFAYLLFEEWMGWTKAEVHINSGKLLKGEESARFWDALAQLQKNKPIQYIIGVTHFLGTKIKVREGVLIPRPETEELTAIILRDYRHRQYEELSLLDIGTGSGCIPVAIKKHMPGMDVTTLDISPLALQLAKENSTLNQCLVKFILADILDRQGWKAFPGLSAIRPISLKVKVYGCIRMLLNMNLTKRCL
jgi:release factor glutamine methyltransferase